MSDDLIKKEEAKEAVCKGCLKDWGLCHHHWDCPMLMNLEMLLSTTADVDPVAFNRFAEWVADWVLRSDFEESAGGFAELACRRLEDLGIMRKDGNVWVMDE